MDEFKLDPTNYKMKSNRDMGVGQNRIGFITEETLSSLASMSKDELISLIKLVSGAIWGHALATNEERREAMKLKIAHIALTAQDNHTVLKACNDWLDREEGKAVQRIDQRVLNMHKGAAPGDMTNEQLLAAISKLADSKQLPGNVKLLEDGTLDIIDVTPLDIVSVDNSAGE